MADPAPPPPNGGRVGDLLSRVLSFVDRPWKAVFTIVVLVLGFGSWFVWHERERLLAPGEIKIDEALIPALVPRYENDTDADIVAVWSIDVHANAARYVRGYRRGGQDWSFQPPRVPFIVGSSDTAKLIRLFAGHTVCADLEEDALFAKRLSMMRLMEAGITRVCVTPIPPNPTRFLGLMVTAWRHRPPQDVEDAAVAQAGEIADRLAH